MATNEPRDKRTVEGIDGSIHGISNGRVTVQFHFSAALFKNTYLYCIFTNNRGICRVKDRIKEHIIDRSIKSFIGKLILRCIIKFLNIFQIHYVQEFMRAIYDFLLNIWRIFKTIKINIKKLNTNIFVEHKNSLTA